MPSIIASPGTAFCTETYLAELRVAPEESGLAGNPFIQDNATQEYSRMADRAPTILQAFLLALIGEVATPRTR